MPLFIDLFAHQKQNAPTNMLIFCFKINTNTNSVAYFEATNFFGLKESYYISLHVDYDLDFRVLIHDLNYPKRDEILKQFTAFTFQLHEAGINFWIIRLETHLL